MSAEKDIGAGGTRAAPSAERPAPDCGSGPDLTVGESEPHIGLHENTAETAWDSFPLPLCLPGSRALSQKINMKKIY